MCQSSQDAPPSLAPHLDRYLTLNQTRTFSFVGTRADETAPLMIRMDADPRPFTRQSTHFPLRVDTLRARYHDQVETLAPSRFNAEIFLCLFDPKHINLTSHFLPLEKTFEVGLSGVQWTRLRSLSMNQFGILLPLRTYPFYRDLPSRSIEMCYDVTHGHKVLRDAARRSVIYELAGESEEGSGVPGLATPAIRSICFRVGSEEDKEEMRRSLHLLLVYLCRYNMSRVDRVMAMIRFEVV